MSKQQNTPEKTLAERPLPEEVTLERKFEMATYEGDTRRAYGLDLVVGEDGITGRATVKLLFAQQTVAGGQFYCPEIGEQGCERLMAEAEYRRESGIKKPEFSKMTTAEIKAEIVALRNKTHRRFSESAPSIQSVARNAAVT